MRIGMLVASLPFGRVGGAEVQALHLARGLACRHTVVMLPRSQGFSVQPRSWQMDGLRVWERPNLKIPWIRCVYDIVACLGMIVRLSASVDLWVAYQITIQGCIAAMAKLWRGIPFALFIMGGRDYRLSRFARARYLTPFVVRHASAVFVQSETIRAKLLEELRRFGHDELASSLEPRLFIARNGVEVAGTRGTAPGESILYVGRLIRKKGLDHLLEAMRRLGSEELVVIGDGTAARRFKRRARGARVRFLGRISHEEVQREYAGAKVLVLPSITEEGVPNVIMEAMAHGVPAIASRVGGIADLVEHGTTGFLTAPGDVEDLVRYLRKLAKDERLRKSMGENCLREIQKYDWRRVLVDTERLLQAVIDRQVRNQA